MFLKQFFLPIEHGFPKMIFCRFDAKSKVWLILFRFSLNNDLRTLGVQNHFTHKLLQQNLSQDGTRLALLSLTLKNLIRFFSPSKLIAVLSGGMLGMWNLIDLLERPCNLSSSHVCFNGSMILFYLALYSNNLYNLFLALTR